jgi:O-antigen ligase
MLRPVRARNVLMAVGWTGATLALGVLLSSLFHSTNLTVRLATFALCALSILRPQAGVLVAIAFVGLGSILAPLSGERTLRADEAIVVVSLLGWCVSQVLRSFRPHAGCGFRGLNVAPIALLGLTALCSTLVWMRVDQVRTAYLSTYLSIVWDSVSTEYFVRIDRFMELASVATMLESLALYLAVGSMCQEDRTFVNRALRMLIVGGAGLAALSVVRVTEIALRNPEAIAMLRATAPGLRISPLIPDYIAAAAYFALCWTVAMGVGLQRSRQHVIVLAASLLLLAGLFLTGSRSAIGAAGGGILVLAYLALRDTKVLRPVRIIGLAVMALAVLAIAFPRLIGHDLTGTTAGESLKVRFELWKAGVRVLLAHPLFGVGLDRFFLYLDQFSTPQLKAMWTGRLNPHNDFLRIAAELGLIGLSLFLWTLVGSAVRIARGWSSGNLRLAGLIGGLTAFLITMFISNPLMVRPTSYLFWLALGLATGTAAAAAPSSDTSTIVQPRVWWRRTLVPLCGCAIIASVPLRASHEIAGANLAGVTYGLYGWTAAPDGTASRVSGPTATIFVAADARMVEFSLSGTLPTGRPQNVEAFVDGRLANQVSVGNQPQRLRIPLPKRTGRSHRIDLRVSPTWIPADVEPASDDHRVLGIRIGEVAVLRDAAGGR